MRVLFQSVKKAGMIWVSEPIGLSIWKKIFAKVEASQLKKGSFAF